MRICAGATLLKNGEILLGLRSSQSDFYPDRWDIFGGHCEEGETIEDTLARELEEELGVRPIRYEALGVFDEPNPRDHGEARYHVFVVYEWMGEPTNCGDEHLKIQWFHVDELHGINLALEKYLEFFSQFERGI